MSMNGVKNATLNILTKGQKAALKSAEQQQKIDQERAHRDTVIKAALEFINSEIADNIFKDIVVDFKTKGFASFNYYLNLGDYEEILLIGSGKGVASVKNIKQIGWKRKKLDQYKIFSKYYNLAINRSNLYKF